MKKSLFLLFFVLVSLAANAGDNDSLTVEIKTEKGIVRAYHKVYDFFDHFFSDYDTTYIEPNKYNLMAMVQNTNYAQAYRLSTKGDNGRKTITMMPTPSVSIGPYFGWRWLVFGYTFDVIGKSKLRSSWNLSFYTNPFGVDFVYMKNNGDFKIQKTEGFEGIDKHQFKGETLPDMKSRICSLNLYYILNHKHFSYPAVFNQSTQQKKSSGSAIFGFRYDHQKFLFDTDNLPEELREKLERKEEFDEINYNCYSLSAGYGYNWAFAKNWCLGASLTPAIGLTVIKNSDKDHPEDNGKRYNASFDAVGRLGIVYNNSRWIAGMSLISHLYDYRKNTVSLTNSLNYLNFYVAYNFIPR